MTSRTGKWSHGLVLAVLLSIAFLALSFVPTWGDLRSAIFGGRVIDSTLSQPIWGTRLGYRLLGFVGALVLVHAALGVVAWLLGQASLRAFPKASNGPRAWVALWVLVLIGWVLMANSAWFSYSQLGAPYHDLVSAGIGPLDLFSIVTALIAVAAGYVLVVAVAHYLRALRRSHYAAVAAAAVAVVIAVPIFGRADSAVAPRNEKPHVIVVGIDSLRPDYVRNDEYRLTPSIDDFLSRAVIFSDTVTPLARTFPAWVSLVSGKHPHSSGAIINLFPRELIDDGETLPDVLRKSGYQTVYAIDEVRFSNLDTSYGFDSMISPPMGSADFLLGYVYDFPLSNILVNTIVGRVLFPFTHANRAAAATYDPDAFVDLLDDRLNFDEPTFLAVHLTLPHWPYRWATTPKSETSRELSIRERYEQSVERVDRQFDDVMQILEERGALQNAIVVVLSDHGESLGEIDTTKAHGDFEGPAVFGHGINVFSLEQYQVLFSMRAFGNDILPSDRTRVIDAPASLEDFAPTMVDLLDARETDSYGGWSLVPVLDDEANAELWRGRIRFIETEYDPPGFTTNGIPNASQIADAAQTYIVDPETDLLSVRPGMVDEILGGRQYAAMRDGAMLAALPIEHNKRQRLVFVEGGVNPVDLNDAPDENSHPRAFDLWEALFDRFRIVRERPFAAAATDEKPSMTERE